MPHQAAGGRCHPRGGARVGGAVGRAGREGQARVRVRGGGREADVGELGQRARDVAHHRRVGVRAEREQRLESAGGEDGGADGVALPGACPTRSGRSGVLSSVDREASRALLSVERGFCPLSEAVTGWLSRTVARGGGDVGEGARGGAQDRHLGVQRVQQVHEDGERPLRHELARGGRRGRQRGQAVQAHLPARASVSVS
jgi:hypothetical protein